MYIFKSVLLFLLIQLVLGLFLLNPQSLTRESQADTSKDNSNSGMTFSSKFLRLEYALLNQQIKYSIADSISSLINVFEKDYLFALVKNRKTKYYESIKKLYDYLPRFPRHYQYYDQLIFNAKASGNFSKIVDFISKSKFNRSEYSDYLASLVNFNLNKYSDVIKTLSSKDEFNALYLLSFAYRGLADYEQSLGALQKCKRKIDAADLNMPKVMVAEGSLYLLSGDYKVASGIYQKAIKMAELLNNKKEKAKLLINLAILDDQNGKTDIARNKLETALALSRIIENQDIEANVLSELGVSYTYSNDIVNARNNYEKSLSLYQVLNNQERLSNLSANIAAIFAQQANYSLALSFYDTGLNYAGENTFSKILNLRGLGDVYANLSNYSKALNYYTQAKELAKLIKNIDSETDIDISIGTLFFNISRPQKALEIFLKAKEKLDKSANLYLKEDANFKIGLAYSRLDSIEKSHIFLREALNISQSIGDIYYNILISNEIAYNYYLDRKYQSAEKILLSLLSKSKKSGFPQLESVQNLYFGKIKLDKKDISTAISFFEITENLAASIKDYNTFLAAEFLLGKCFELKENLVKAEYYYKTAVRTIDEISESMVNNSEIQISHFAGLNEPFNALAELYLRQGKNEQALQIIEKSRSRNTLQNLSNLLINSRIKDEKVLRKFYDLRWQINSGIFNGDSLKSLEAELKSFSEKNQIPGDKSENPFSVRNVQANLTEDENIITYFLSDTALWTFVISKNNFNVIKLDISRNEIKNMIRHISALYNEKTNENDIYFNQDLFSFNAQASNEFYKSIIKKVISSIPQNEKLIFSLPTEMALIPMEFLVTDFDNGDSPFLYDNKSYLIEKFAISYTPSISIYLLQNHLNNSLNQKGLFVGDPQISNKDFATSYRGGLLEEKPFNSRSILLIPLKYSKQEIEEVSDMFPDKYVFLAKDATEKNFKENAASSSIIHLSTHSFLYKDQPLIIFSQNMDEDSKEDGYLEAGEINQLKLNTDLVVLSSCRSGVGAVDKAEGIIGMQKSFFEAGAKSVIVTLWDVNDKYTSLFMQSFYKYLVEGYGKSEALRRAKIFFKKNYSPNPYYWAAFVLSGDVSQIKISRANHSYLILIILSVILIGLFLAYNKKIKRN